MSTLQSRWHTALASGLLVEPGTFQIIQPSPPLSPTDTALWAAENLLPPAAATFNTDLSAGAQFFSSYASVACQQQFPQSSFEQDIGSGVYQAWTAYVKSIQPPPTASQLPALFQQWAMRNAPAVVQVGVADLSTMALIEAAQQALVPYEGPNAQPVDFAGGFTQLLEILSQSPGGKANFDSRPTGSSNDGSAESIRPRIYGLWAGASSASFLSRRFAASHVTVSAAFQAYTVWGSIPGAWYNSSLLNTAYSTQSSPPWPPNPDPTWNDLFGPGGSMRQLIASLLVADALTVTVTSDATYTDDDQQEILDNTSQGMWPFFVPSGENVTNTVSFPGASGMQIDTATQSGNPIVIGAIVLGIAQYLGRPAPPP
jgi:hypothetical protein